MSAEPLTRASASTPGSHCTYYVWYVLSPTSWKTSLTSASEI